MKKITPEYNLQIINPTLAKQWHPKKNGSLTPKDVSPNSNKKVWWICERNHEWAATIRNRNRGHGCPYCPRPKIIETFADKKLKKANMRIDAATRGFMRKVGKTSSGNILVEMSPAEWKRIALSKGLPDDLPVAMIKYRKQHGLSQKDFADKIGISRTRVQEIERGLIRNLTYGTYERIISTIS